MDINFMSMSIDKEDIEQAEKILPQLTSWLVSHTTSLSTAALILQGAEKEIQKAKEEIEK